MKFGMHAVESRAIVELGVGELLEVLDGLGCLLVEQVDDDRALAGVERGGLGHGSGDLG
jgi:hypothetical protein